jgi:hypothetical protein
MTSFQAALANRFGEHRVSEVPTLEGEMPLLALDLELSTPVTVIITNGLSDYQMPVPEKVAGREFNEIYFCLPSYWEWEELENPRMNWIFPWIQRLAKYVVDKQTWFGAGHTLPCGKEMQELSETMRQNHFFLSDPILLEQQLAPIEVDGKIIYMLAIIPIFPDEMDYKQGKGTFKFLQKLSNQGVTEKLDDFRSTILKSKWRLRR